MQLQKQGYNVSFIFYQECCLQEATDGDRIK